MTPATVNTDVCNFILRLDSASQAHMEWTRRILRCAVLRRSPGDDLMADDAHERCQFGTWFRGCRHQFDAIAPDTAHHLDQQHHLMHGAARDLCLGILQGRVDGAALQVFEGAQDAMVADLALLKTLCLARSARLDALTGLPLRHGLEAEFARCKAQAARRGEEVVVVLLDVDDFKRINDAHGHATGDLALQHIAGLLHAQCRGDELLVRFGGDEFLMLLQVAGAAAAEHLVERALHALRNLPLRLADNTELSLRLSAGLAVTGPEETMAGVLARADHALYAAKAAGRDTWRWVVETRVASGSNEPRS
ncbi:MAG: diguanylate cyclase [Pseudomonadota bacterium]|nr:diguanylate cyclase [Pseudomonadota bacterium]